MIANAHPAAAPGSAPPATGARATQAASALEAAADAIRSRADAPAGFVLGVHDEDGRSVVARGSRDDAGTPIHADDVFDLASVTKVMATTALLMRLATLENLNLDDPASRYLGWLGVDKNHITVRDLLAHRSGLWEWQPFYTRAASKVALHEQITRLPLRYATGEGWHYSDLGFMILGAVVETITDTPLDVAYEELLARPLGLTSGYRSRIGERTFVTSARDNAAEQHMIATGQPYPILLGREFESWRNGPIVGEVNDANAHYCSGGVCGHAGLFATVGDLLAFGRVLAVPTQREALFSEAIVNEVFGESREPGQALGFRREQRMFHGERATVYWHPGFTGCALGLVPAHGAAIALGSNRLLARGEPAPVAQLWGTLMGALGFEQQGKA